MTAERWVALVACLLLVAACWQFARRSLARGDGLITAETVFLTVWAAVLGLFAIPWIRYTPSSLEAWLAIYGSIAAFLVGCLAARRALRNVASGRQGETDSFNPRRFSIVWALLFALGFIGFAGFVHAVDAAIGWHTLISNPASARAIQSSSAVFKAEYGPWKFLTYFNQIAFLLWTIGVRGRLFKGPWRIAIVVGWASLLPYVFTGDRTLILTSLTWAILFQFLWRPPRQPKRLAAIVAATTIGLVAVFVVLGERAGKSINKFPDIAAQMTTPGPKALALPYVYLTANIPTFSQLTEDPIRPQTDGKLTILPVVKILHKLGIGSTPPEQVGSFYPIPFETFNNYSWLGNIYMDLGLVGCLLIPLLFGFLACWLVLLALRRGSLISCWMGSLMLFVVAYSPMINKLASTLIWQYVIVGPFVLLAVRDNPGPREYLARLLARLRALPRPWKAIAATGSIAALALLGFAAVSGRHAKAVPPSPQASLDKALALAKLTEKNGRYPTSFALSTRLRAAVPGTSFQEVCSASGAPLAEDVIGVFTRKGRLRLTTRMPDGSVLSTAHGSIDLSRPGLSVRLNLPEGDTTLIPAFKGEIGWAVATFEMPSLPPADTKVSVVFESTRSDLVEKAHPYMLLRFANGPGFQHCSDAAVMSTPPPFFKIPLVRKPLEAATAAGLTRYVASDVATAPGLVRIDLLAEGRAEAALVKRSVRGGFRVWIQTPGGSR